MQDYLFRQGINGRLYLKYGIIYDAVFLIGDDILKNLVSSGTADKLINNKYLHSNTDNFANVVKQHSATLSFGSLDNDLLINMRKRLEELIEETNIQMNQFYEDISAYYINIGQQNKAIQGRDKYSNGVYKPDGANEFSKKFLINSKGNNLTEEQIILSIINSSESKNKLREIYQDVNSNFKFAKVKNFTQEQKNIINILNKAFNNGNKLLKGVNNITYSNIEKYIDSIFIKNRKNRAYGLKISKKMNKKELSKEKTRIDNIVEELGLKNFSGHRQENLNELKNLLTNKLKNIDLFYSIGLQYWDKYLNVKFKEKTGKTLDGRKRVKFARFFKETLSRYNVNLIDTKQETSLNGFLLEYGLYASINLPLKAGQEIVNILGQEKVVRTYITEEYDMVGNVSEGNKKITGQSPSGIEYLGASGRKYRFQLKNNFNDVSKALSFRSQAEIKVSTYMATAFNKVNVDIKNILTYFLINAAFLRKYGLGAYNTGEETLFRPKDFPLIRDYILFFLQQSYQFLIGYQYGENIEKAQGITAGNVAYIFKGKYLIPVAAYFYSALEMLQKVLNTGYKPQGIGGIAGLPSFKNINTLGITNIEFQENKANLLDKLKYNDNVYKEYKYPQGLLEYGSSYGQKLYNKLSFERISIVLIIDQLDKYFKQ